MPDLETRPSLSPVMVRDLWPLADTQPRVHASRLRETGIAGHSYIADICIVFFVAITSLLVFSYSGIGLLGKYTAP